MVTMDPDNLALPAFVISIVGLGVAMIGAATGVAALVWQIITRTRGSHRVVTRAHSNVMMVLGDEVLGPFVQVEIANRGQAAVQIRSWRIQFADGSGMTVLVPPAQIVVPSLPHLLEAGTSVSFWAPVDGLVEAHDSRDFRNARVTVSLATGQTVKSKRGVIKVG